MKNELVKIGRNVFIDDNVIIGPFSIIEKGVTIASGTQLGSHVYIGQYTQIGKNNRIAQGSVLGGFPQDRKWMNYDINKQNKLRKKYSIIIEDNNVINEYVTIHHGLEKNTFIGKQNLIMGQVHLGHDVIIKNNVTIANQSLLAGHVQVNDGVFISGHVSIHQNTFIGTLAMIGSQCFIRKDVPPYALIAKNLIYGANVNGMKKFNFSLKEIDFIKNIYQVIFFRKKILQECILELENLMNKIKKDYHFNHSYQLIIDNFLYHMKRSKRGFVKCPDRFTKMNKEWSFVL